MKHIILSTVILFSTQLFAGPITSGGLSQVIESCSNDTQDYQLHISATHSANLVADFSDYSSLTSSMVYSDQVSIKNEGYQGNTLNITFEYINQVKYATVVVESSDFNTEPLVYTNLICQESLK